MRSLLLLSLLPISALHAQNPVRFELKTGAPRVAPGQTVRLTLAAEIERGWHLYSITSPVTPTATRITLPDDSPLAITRLLQPKVEPTFDPAAAAATENYEEHASFLIDAAVKSDAKPGPAEITVNLRSSACNDKSCLPPRRRTVTTRIDIDPAAPPTQLAAIPDGYVEAKAGAAAPASASSGTASQASPPTDKAGKPDGAAPVPESLAGFVLVAFGLGLAAIFTPCVFPMIPFTLSYFLNREGTSRREGLQQAAIFCVGIIVLFTAIGLTASAVLGPFGAQQLSSNPWVNGVIAAVFFAFAVSMLGAFEITLPSGLLTRMNSASEGGGVVGSLLMGLTFSLTSFACVGPFMGSLLAASVQGDKLQPVMGMSAFAAGLASPFFLLALFPAWLKKLPRSGGWLVRVKVVMAFFIFAMAIKYLSNIDQVLQWNLLTRERFLGLWIVLFAMPGFYLLGWLNFEGIKREEPLSIPRLVLAIGFLSFSLFLFSGLNGAPLGELDAMVPVSTRPIGPGTAGAAGLEWRKNQYQEALAQGKAEGKLVFVSFTGYACTNCHWMKANMFPKPEVHSELSKFILVELYTDGLDAPSEENQKLQESRFSTVATPFYVIMDGDGNALRTFPSLTRDVQEFVRFLKG